MPEAEKKVKLTLSVDENTVKKAKSLGLNLSEITEDALKQCAFKSEGNETGSLYSKYQELFDSMLPLLKEYNAFVKIAVEEEDDQYGNPQYIRPIYLYSDGSYERDEGEDCPFNTTLRDIHSIQISDFLQPNQILNNFIEALAKAKEKRDKRIGEIEMAKAIIAAITEKATKTDDHEKAGNGVDNTGKG